MRRDIWKWAVFLLYCGLVCGPASPSATAAVPKATLFNPAPLEKDLVLAGPDGAEFVFRPVYVNGESVLGGSTFVIGDAAGDDFRAPPTKVVVGGAFEGDVDTGPWLYYLGKYEVTEAQYKAVMGSLPGGKAITGKGEQPVVNVSYFEALVFTDTLNKWFYTHALSALPTAGSFPAYVRLPSEVEWEFAARGGLGVPPVVFEAPHPYGEEEELAAYEWFSGPKSSHNKIHPVGKLKPNPLGLHDMLGNVQEMTLSLYQIEYYQGRSGGFASRGGHYLTPEDDLRAALRREEVYYLGSQEKGMRPNTKATMGFRLALSAPLLTDRDTIDAIETAWDQHRNGEGKTQPAALSVAPVSEQEDVSVGDALARLQRMRAEATEGKPIPDLSRQLAYAESELKNTARIREQADADSAAVWVRITAERGMFLAYQLARLEIIRDAPAENLRKQTEEFTYNIENGLEKYRTYLVQLGKLRPDLVQAAFDGFYTELTRRITEAEGQEAEIGAELSKRRVQDLTAQQQKLAITRRHYEKFAKEKRADATAWRGDYAPKPSM